VQRSLQNLEARTKYNKSLSLSFLYILRVNDMITIFGDFQQFSWKPMLWSFSAFNSVLWGKKRNFFSKKIIKSVLRHILMQNMCNLLTRGSRCCCCRRTHGRGRRSPVSSWPPCRTRRTTSSPCGSSPTLQTIQTLARQVEWEQVGPGQACKCGLGSGLGLLRAWPGLAWFTGLGSGLWA
jgi:hypothetical protein